MITREQERLAKQGRKGSLIETTEAIMKKYKIYLVMLAITLTYSTVSCVSLQDKTMTSQERLSAEIVGSVTAEFSSFQFLHIHNKSAIRNKAYAELKKEAQKRFPGNIDIMNIAVSGSFSAWNIPFILAIYGPVWADIQKITATGDVVLYSTDAGKTRNFQQMIEGALARAADDTLKNVPQGSKIAIVYITAQDKNTTDYIAGELEYIWVNEGFTIIMYRKPPAMPGRLEKAMPCRA
jgi:hypothetical protein